MPAVGFEPTILANAGPLTYALDPGDRKRHFVCVNRVLPDVSRRILTLYVCATVCLVVECCYVRRYINVLQTRLSLVSVAYVVFCMNFGNVEVPKVSGR
jgi:hypothetical protein